MTLLSWQAPMKTITQSSLFFLPTVSRAIFNSCLQLIKQHLGSSRDGPTRIDRYASLIHGENLTNVTICGSGRIEGQGQPWYDMKLGYSQRPLLHGRPAVIELLWSSNVQIRNITITNSPFWAIHPAYCSDVIIDGVSIINPWKSPNTDGIDIDSCDNVTVTNNYITCGDDNIAIKSGLSKHPHSSLLPYSLTCTNVTNLA